MTTSVHDAIKQAVNNYINNHAVDAQTAATLRELADNDPIAALATLVSYIV